MPLQPFSLLRQPLHRPAMRGLARLEDEQKSGAIWYKNFRQSP